MILLRLVTRAVEPISSLRAHSLSSSSHAQQCSRQSDQTAADHDPEHIGFEPIERDKSGDTHDDREPVRSAHQFMRPDHRRAEDQRKIQNNTVERVQKSLFTQSPYVTEIEL